MNTPRHGKDELVRVYAEAQAWKITIDMVLYGIGYMKDCKHVPFKDVKSEDDYDKSFTTDIMTSAFHGLHKRYSDRLPVMLDAPDRQWFTLGKSPAPVIPEDPLLMDLARAEEHFKDRKLSDTLFNHIADDPDTNRTAMQIQEEQMRILMNESKQLTRIKEK